MNSTTLTITESTTVRATQAAGSALVWNNAITTQDLDSFNTAETNQIFLTSSTLLKSETLTDQRSEANTPIYTKYISRACF